MKTSSSSLIGLGVVSAVIVTVFSLYGCGGGGGSASSAPPARSAANSQTRLIEATRVSRTLLAITGLGRTISRAATPPTQSRFSVSGRQQQILSVLATHRSASSRSTPAPALDPATGLYYTTKLQANGSGEQLLYTDQALTKPAGIVVISAPQWATSTGGTYPANLSEDYNITAGSYSGVSGTLQATVSDAAFTTGRCVLAMTDQEGDAASADLSLSNEALSGKCKMKFKDGDTCDGTDFTESDGDIDQGWSWPDGCFGGLSTDPDGTSTQTYTNPDATTASPDLTGTVQPDGTDTIQTSPGDSSSSNVNPGTDDSSGGSTGGTSGGSGSGSGGTGGGSGSGSGGGSGGS